ncbi:TonB-dependent siderophore receptor [Gloeobacter morelensis]|uniref:TonB-dependent siderophore receptor n=1 Tax=Gloeobacter morelensis MG652769 TaxID=2781736 RepID=A0ABY3PJN5_9CYAN|nr:TonB-dependent siderophore receptor [Gloeobacter morelensis]UFP93836.1 TonB-dependent siderophore receptor [Gloeobacter morelensis MG652769]
MVGSKTLQAWGGALVVSAGLHIAGLDSQLLAKNIEIGAYQVPVPRRDELPVGTASARSLGEVTLAQAEPAPAPAQPDAADLDEVTVEGTRYFRKNTSSATRTDTPILDIPQSVQVIPRQVLEDQQATRLGDAVRNVSGVVTGNTFAGAFDRFIIRGFSSFELLRNGFRDSEGAAKDISNFEQVEVLKGPSSITYGLLEPGGIVNYVTKKPLRRAYYAAEVKVGSFSLVRPTVDFSGPITADGNLLYRLNAAYESSNGFRDFSDFERWFASPVITWQASEATQLTFEADLLRDARPFDRGLIAFGRGVVDVPYSRRFGEPGDYYKVQQLAYGVRIDHKATEAWQVRSGLRFNFQSLRDYRAEPVNFNESTGILTRNFRGNDDINETYAWQTDVIGKFKTDSIDHTLLVGFEYFRGFADGQQRRAAPGTTPSLNIFNPVYGAVQQPLTVTVRDGFSGLSSLGFYLQDQIAFTPWLQLVAGGRYDVVEQQALDRLNQSYTLQRDQAITPRVGLLLKPASNVSIYGSYSRSFTPLLGLSREGTSFRPETGTQYEVGVKAELLDNRLFATVAAYEITKENVLTTDPSDPGFAIQVGEQKSRGLEFDVIGQLAEGWRVVTSYALNEAVVSRDNDFPVGNRLPGAPGNTASFWTDYQFKTGSLAGLGIGAGLFYVDNRTGDLDNSFEVPSYIRTDATLSYRFSGWKAALSVRNLFDVRYIESPAFRTSIIPGAPITFVGSLSAEF